MYNVVYERDPNDVKIAYICDRQQCEKCGYPLCSHTTDIAHAVNFKNFADGGDFMYMEIDRENGESMKLQDIFEHIENAFNRTPYEGSWITDTGERVSCDVGYAYDWWENYMKPELIRVFGKEE